MMNGAYGAAYNGGFGNFAGCGGGVFGLHLSTLLFVGLAILAFYLFFKNKKQPRKKDPIFISETSSIDASEIVRLRYARGEISLEEFQNILKNIQS
jgi:putative membrane protein